jgi:glycine hydroxymethyltransferase
MGYALHRARTEEFQTLMRKVVSNAQAFCDALLKRGFGVVTGGTDCHMFVADLRPFGTDCERLADVMQDVGITVNTKGIPYDDSPKARGLRAGTTVLTQRGMGPREMEQVADLWKMLAIGMDNPEMVQTVRERVLDLAERFPLPSD